MDRRCHRVVGLSPVLRRHRPCSDASQILYGLISSAHRAQTFLHASIPGCTHDAKYALVFTQCHSTSQLRAAERAPRLFLAGEWLMTVLGAALLTHCRLVASNGERAVSLPLFSCPPRVQSLSSSSFRSSTEFTPSAVKRSWYWLRPHVASKVKRNSSFASFHSYFTLKLI